MLKINIYNESGGSKTEYVKKEDASGELHQPAGRKTWRKMSEERIMPLGVL